MATPLNPKDTLAPSGATGVVTINPTDTIGTNVQYYRYNDNPSNVYQNSMYSTAAPVGSSSAVSTDQLQASTAIKVPAPDTSLAEANGAVEGAKTATKSIDAHIKEITPQETEASKKYNEITDSVLSLLPELADKKTAQLEEEENAGLPKLKQDLAAINAQITNRIAQYNKQITEAETAPGETPLAIVRGRQAVIARNQAADIGLLQARALGLQGQVEMAQETANRAIDLKYGAIEDKINLQMKQLEVIQPILDKEERLHAEALRRQYADEQAKVEAERELQKEINSIMIDAASMGADNDTLARIQNSMSTGDAIRNAGDFLSAEFRMKQDQIEFERWLQLEQLGLDRMKLEQQMADLSLDPTQLKAYAQQYAATGKIPTGLPEGAFGLVAEAAANLPKQPGTIVDVNTGVKPDVSDVKLEGTAALYDLTKKVEEARTLFDGFSTGLIAGSWNKVFPTRENTRYTVLRKEIVDLLSRARSGAALTEEEVANYESKLPSRFVKGAWTGPNGEDLLDGLVKSLTDKLDTHLSANGMDIIGYKDIENQAAEFDEDFNKVEADTNSGLKATKPGFKPLSQVPMLKELPLLKPIQSKFPQGATGGQCVTFLHKIADFPSIGDGKQEKIASVNKFGIPKARWTPRVGDVVITGENKTYGHGFMINQLLPGGKARVTESNYKLNEKVTHTRIVDLNNPIIYGAIRPRKFKL